MEDRQGDPDTKISRFSNIDVSDLRPISVLSVVSKVMNVAEERGWLSDSQCGFRRRVSTLDNLSVLVDDVLKNWGDDDDGLLGSSPKALILAKTYLFDPVIDH